MGGTPARVPPETGALPESLGAALAALLQLALDAQQERSRSAPASHQAAAHRVEINLERDPHSTSAEQHRTLNMIASLVAETARMDAARPEQVVYALRALWSRVPRPNTVTPEEWDVVYHRILGKCLQEFYTGP